MEIAAVLSAKQMKALQSRALSNLLSYREDGYRSCVSYVRRSTTKYIRLLVVYFAAIGVILVLGQNLLAMFLCGVLCGKLVRDYQWIVAQDAFWPVHQELIDWDKAEKLHLELVDSMEE